MLLSSRSRNKKWIIGGALVVPLLVLWIFKGASIPTSSDATREALNSSRTFSLDQIEGIENVYLAATSLPSKSDLADPASSIAGVGIVNAAILPHHTLIAKQLGEFWTQISVDTQPSVIVILSPAHEDQGIEKTQTTKGNWKFKDETVRTDAKLVDELIADGIASDEPDSFENEHGVGVQLPYIAVLFPDAKIVPILFKSTAGQSEALAIADELKRILPPDALVIASIDFSHYLPTAVSDELDKETIAAISSRDYAEIDTYHSEHVDSPAALEAYLMLSDAMGWGSNFIWHENSARALGSIDLGGTSYLVYFASVRAAHIVLTAAGDIMLGRNVATVLAKTTIEEAFADAAAAFAGSDLAFANVESVLTFSNTDTGKSIFFKADPARVDVLNLIGLTDVSVANNHVDDYAYAGWAESVQHLKDAGIQPVGDYRNQTAPVFEEVNGTRVAFLAYEDLLRPLDDAALLEQVKAAKAQADIVAVSFHWGVEYHHTPTNRQIELAHTVIDAGADVVIGTHPHYLQTIETYGGGLILYSLGNFIFDQIGEDENESLVVRLNLCPALRAGQGSECPRRTLDLIPMRIKNRFPRMATDEERIETLFRLASWSDPTLADEIESGTLMW